MKEYYEAFYAMCLEMDTDFFLKHGKNLDHLVEKMERYAALIKECKDEN